MSIRNIIVSLRNTTGSPIVLGTLSISAGNSSTIWDTVNYTNVVDNFSQVLVGIATFNEGIGSGALVLVLNSVDQNSDNAFVQFHELQSAFQTIPGDVFTVIRLEHESAVGLSDLMLTDGSQVMAGDLNMDGYSVTNINLVDGINVTDHKARHISGGSDQIDGYQIALVYSPTNYTAPIANVIGQHIARIDTKLTSVAGGDVVGPTSATDNAIVRWNQTTGKLIQDSLITIDDVGLLQINGGPTLFNNLGDLQISCGGNLRMTIADSAIVVNTLPIQGVVDPTNAQDVATKFYSDAASPNRVECATVAQSPITLSGNQSINGITTTTGMRVLVTAQAAGAQNGIYLANSGAWTRAPDLSTSEQANRGVVVYINNGARSRNTWTLTNNTAVTLGTTTLIFEEGSLVFGVSVPVGIAGTASVGSAPTTSRADHVHNITFTIINGILGTANASVSVNSQKITNLLTPTLATDAVTKGYVDGYFVSNLSSSTPAAVSTAGVVGTATKSARDDHVHALSFATVNSILGTANASISVNSQKITNLLNPTAAQDAATKAYVDAGGTGAFANGGDTAGANRTLGNNDGYSMGFETNNIVHLLINADGSIVTTNSTAGSNAFTIKGAASQSGDLLFLANSAGAELSCFNKDGYLRIAGVDSAFPNATMFISRPITNTYMQSVVQNTSSGASASTDLVVVADTGTDSSRYLDIGINSSTYSDPAFTGQAALDSYIQAYDGYLNIGTASANKFIKFNTGGTLIANQRMLIADTAIVLNSLPIQGVSDPTNAQDAATKAYVDANAATQSGYRTTCRVATTANITLSGTQTIDGISVVATDRVFVKNQSTSANNGIYVCAAGAWTRATDFNTSAHANVGLVVHIKTGTVNGNTLWALTTQPTITLGTTGLYFYLVQVDASTPANVTKAAAAAGTSNYLARIDHKHDITTAAAVATTVGGSNTEGTSTSLSRADHVHALVAYGTTTGTIAQGDDSRFTNDRTASGIRTATTIVSVSAATAPTIGQVLTATSSTTATWQTGGGGGGVSLTNSAPQNVTKATASVGTDGYAARADHKHDITTAAPVSIGAINSEGSATSLARSDHVHAIGHALLIQVFGASDFDDPGTEWSTTVPAAIAIDGVNAAIIVRRFDDTTEEGVGWSSYIPPSVTQIKFTLMSKGVTAPAATRTVGLSLKRREITDNAAFSAWSATTMTDISIPTNVNFQRDTQTITLSTLSMTADRFYQFELVRQNPTGGTELTGDWSLYSLIVEFLV